MKRILFIVALLPFLVKAQSINNQKVRWMQPVYMGNNTPAALNASADTSAFFFNSADSLLYFKYKGSSRAIAYTSTVPTIDSFSYSTRAWRQKGVDSVTALISPRITDSLRSLVRLRASGSGGIQLQNSNGTNVADFGTANTTNGSIAGGWNVGANLSVTGTSGFTGKSTFTDSIVGVNQRLSGTLNTLGSITTTNGNVTAGGAEPYLIARGTINSSFRGLKIFGQSDGNTEFAFSMANFTTGEFRHSAGFTTYGGFHTWYTNGTEVMRLNTNGSLSVTGALTATAQGNNITVGVDSSITSTSYTLVLGDAGYLKRCSNASAITITVPTNASVAFPIGTTIYFSQQGAGKVSVSPATSDVTIQSEGSLLGTAGQHAVIGLIKVNTNRWLLVGNRG